MVPKYFSDIPSLLQNAHFSNKCDKKGFCYFPTGKNEITNNNCGGKLCRYKCRCENRFKLTEEEISVYRQITHYWDGGVDYYTGNELIKHRKMKKLREEYKLLQKQNIKPGLVQAGKIGEATQASLQQYRQCQCKKCQTKMAEKMPENNSLKSN